MKPRAYFFVGPPSSGKSVYRRSLVKLHRHRGWTVVSYDDFVMTEAERMRIKPNVAWANSEQRARAYAKQQFQNAIRNRRPLVIDLHDLTSRQVRKEWLEQLPETYEKIALVCETQLSPAQINRDVPAFEMVTNDEGFDEVRIQPAVKPEDKIASYV